MEAMQLVNRADVFATTNLGNIGFCWMGAWGNGGSYTWMSKDNIDHARKMYLDAGNLLKEILEKRKREPRHTIIWPLYATGCFVPCFIWTLSGRP